MPKSKSQRKRIAREFDREALARICEMRERDFASAYDLTTTKVKQAKPYDWFHFRDNGASVLAVAHLDTVSGADQRRASFADTIDGPVCFSRALDDRLGAYVILELLPRLGLKYDVLLATGEECARSTAAFFETEKDYDWIIEFDRAGTDVVLYDYEDNLTRNLVKASGARVGIGSFSDISLMEHVGVKAFNWGVGYEDAHGKRAHAFLNDTFEMVGKYLTFHDQNEGRTLAHEGGSGWGNWGGWTYRSGSRGWDSHSWDSVPGEDEPRVKLTLAGGNDAEADDPYDYWECDGCNDWIEATELVSVNIPGTGNERFAFCPGCLDWARDQGWTERGAVA